MVSVCFGGTFTVLHRGHKRLLCRAVELGDLIEIGVTGDELAAKMGKSHEVRRYEERVSSLMDFVQTLELGGKEVTTMELKDPYGPALTEDYTYIVVSPETRPTACVINKIRMGEGRRAIMIDLVPFILAKDFLPISVTRILGGEIDEEGELRMPFRAGICGPHGDDFDLVVKEELKKLAREIELFRVEAPGGDDPITTAISRAKKASQGAVLGIGIASSESTFCALVDGGGSISLAMSSDPVESFRAAMGKKVRALAED